MRLSIQPFPEMTTLMKSKSSSWTSSGLSRCLALGLVALSLLATKPAHAKGERNFNTPEAAVQALIQAAAAHDTNGLQTIFGPTARELANPDKIEAAGAYSLFVQRLTNKVEQVTDSASRIRLNLGSDAWPFPIPLVKEQEGWHFDTDQGKQEILNRRIGMNELGAIQVVRAYVDAQREYASQDHSDDEVLEFAQRLRSTPGKRDGLYWSSTQEGEQSPLGPLVAQARQEGYRHEQKALKDTEASPYHGYYFSILTRQGAHAPGGKYNYIINGHMVAGFALVAWPAEWGNTGVMSFIVNQRGKVYQKNLGPKTASVAGNMTTYDPDRSWSLVRE